MSQSNHPPSAPHPPSSDHPPSDGNPSVTRRGFLAFLAAVPFVGLPLVRALGWEPDPWDESRWLVFARVGSVWILENVELPEYTTISGFWLFGGYSHDGIVTGFHADSDRFSIICFNAFVAYEVVEFDASRDVALMQLIDVEHWESWGPERVALAQALMLDPADAELRRGRSLEASVRPHVDELDEIFDRLMG